MEKQEKMQLIKNIKKCFEQNDNIDHKIRFITVAKMQNIDDAVIVNICDDYIKKLCIKKYNL